MKGLKLNRDFKLVGQTLTRRNYNLHNAFDLYTLKKSDILWRYLICLGYDEDSILGMASSIVKVWAVCRHQIGGWVLGEGGTISVILECLLDTDKLIKTKADNDRYVTIAVTSLFCFDRAIASNSRNRVMSAANWLERADELYYFSSRNFNLTEKHILSERASKAANARHVETYELKKQAMDYWREHINPNLSNPKAADLLLKVVALSHRKLVEYVAEAKRENLHSAS